MRFLSCNICSCDILYLEKWLLGWADIVENESRSISKEFSIVLNNMYLVILLSQTRGQAAWQAPLQP